MLIKEPFTLLLIVQKPDGHIERSKGMEEEESHSLHRLMMHYWKAPIELLLKFGSHLKQFELCKDR